MSKDVVPAAERGALALRDTLGKALQLVKQKFGDQDEWNGKVETALQMASKGYDGLREDLRSGVSLLERLNSDLMTDRFHIHDKVNGLANDVKNIISHFEDNIPLALRRTEMLKQKLTDLAHHVSGIVAKHKVSGAADGEFESQIPPQGTLRVDRPVPYLHTMMQRDSDTTLAARDHNARFHRILAAQMGHGGEYVRRVKGSAAGVFTPNTIDPMEEVGSPLPPPPMHNRNAAFNLSARATAPPPGCTCYVAGSRTMCPVCRRMLFESAPDDNRLAGRAAADFPYNGAGDYPANDFDTIPRAARVPHSGYARGVLQHVTVKKAKSSF